ncbi:MAG: cation:proton antiporter, partial [Deltaproteobacteria bacterium]|nr:cation:proton antiporter [Deltaproteobacteria bacterium]
MITHPLLAVGVMLIAGYWLGRAANALQLPRISGYLVAGILLSPSFSNILTHHMIEQQLSVLTEIALGVIAYLIGGSLILDRIKHLGRSILWITLAQALATFLLTTLFLIPVIPFLTGLKGGDYNLINTYIPLALVIGAISVATAPGAILAIVSELKASGPFTSTLLGIIALDDGLAVIFFALSTAVAHTLMHPGSVLWMDMLGETFAEIGFSVLLGILAGYVLKYSAQVVRRREALLMVILGVIFTTAGLASQFHLSPLLACMVAGFVIVNITRRQRDFFLVVEQIEEPLFGLFFGLAGAHVDLVVFKYAGLLAMAALVIRMIGKHLGSWLGARLSGAPKHIQNYLGLALFPQ